MYGPVQVCPRHVVADDVIAALKTCTPSIAEKDLASYSVFMNSHAPNFDRAVDIIP